LSDSPFGCKQSMN